MRHLTLLTVLFLAGCVETVPAPTPEPSSFDPACCGDVEGKVIWEGEIPKVAPLHFPPVMPELFLKESHANPFAPRDLSQAVVYLEGIQPNRARPWDHPGVGIDLKDRDIMIRQGEVNGRVGFVKLGDAFTIVSRDAEIHLLRGRGADNFTLAPPDPDRELKRTPRNAGAIELSSATGFFWMRGFLMVAEHPYFCRCDSAGHFHLPHVPEGTYDLVVWHPNWNIKSFEREPETGNVARVCFEEPFRFRKSIEIRRGQETKVQFPIKP